MKPKVQFYNWKDFSKCNVEIERNESTLLFLTSEKMILQASFLHELVYKKKLFAFVTISQKLHKIWMWKPSEKVYLSLFEN